MRRVTSVVAAVVLVFVLPDVAHACPVCFDSRDENRVAFLATTAFLSFLPLAMVAGAGLWLRKRSREIDEQVGADPTRDELH